MTTVAASRRPGRPGTPPLLAGQLAYAVRDLWRARVVLIFTFVLPLTWLLIIGAVAGNEVVDPATGVRVAQFITPTAAAMGVLYAAYPTVAITLALAREQGVLKRIRGTPLPAWTYLAGRIGGAVAFAVLSVVTMVTVGVLAYDVQVVWRTSLATLVTLVVGVACFAALGLAVAAVSPTAGIAQAGSIASAVALTFVSEMFSLGGAMPVWLSRIGSFFPLKHFVVALQEQFNPFHPGAGWDLGALAVMGAWLLAAVLVAARAFRWDPRTSGRRAVPAATSSRIAAAAPHVTDAGRPATPAMVGSQARWAVLAAWRDPGWVFFAVAMPLGLYALMVVLYGDSDFRPGGLPFAAFFAAGMSAYGTAVTAFVNMPEAVAVNRDKGVLKRLRGTPVSPATYLAGRMVAVLGIAVVTAGLILATGAVFFDVTVPLAALPQLLGVLVLGTLTLAACGFALAALVPSSTALTAVGLAILLPLSFFSDVFLIGDAPAWMSTVGSFFPLLHLVHGLAGALDPGGPALDWTNVAVLLVWLVAASLVAVRRFRWEARR